MSRTGSRLRRRFLACLLVAGLVGSACSVDELTVTPSAERSLAGDGNAVGDGGADSGGQAAERGTRIDGLASGELPAVGPAPGSTHWHAAYIVRICDDVLEPFDSSADPLGIHSHADGLIHIHPFFEEAGFEQAKLGLFTEAMGVELSTGSLTMPDGGTWRDGDLCDGRPGRVFVDRWGDTDPASEVERVFDSPDQLRFEADGELFQIAFAPVDSPPVVPPSVSLIPEVSNLIDVVPEPWVSVPAQADPATIALWPVEDVGAEPCASGQVADAVLYGAGACFTPGDRRFSLDEAVIDARAVFFNRQPAVEIRITPMLRTFLQDSLSAGAGDSADEGLAIALEIDGRVVTAPLLRQASASRDRLIVYGGLSIESARTFAALLAQ